MALHKLVFDATDADTIADSAHVGSHTLDGAGNLITSGTGSADNVADTFRGLDTRSFLFGYDAGGDNWDRVTLTAGALDVNLKSPITVDTDIKGIYDVSTNPTPDNVGLIANTRGATPGATTQIERMTVGVASADAVVAANVHGLDTNSFGMLFNGTTWDRQRGSGATGSADVNITNTITVTDTALANTAILSTATPLTAADTAEPIVTAALANRKYLMVYNNDNRTMYIGATGVTSADGFPLPAGSIVELRAGAAVAVDFVSAKTGHDCRVLELS